MKRITGIQAFLDMLADAGTKYIFGNPGTSELPLMDALIHDQRIQYILALQEIPVMGMADGYAMASRQLGVVNLHISCGLGNAMGMLYNAYREGTPLLVTAGQTDRRLAFEEPILWSDMVRVAEPWTKWAVEVQRVEDLPVALRRAMQTALTPPTGPVFMSLPMDLQSELAELDTSIAKPLDVRVRPPVEAVRQAAQVLTSARNPGILVGSRVQEQDAVAPLVRIADLLGAPVMSESGTTHGRLGFPTDHPLYATGLPPWAPDVRERLQEFDVLLVAGMDLFRLYVYFEPSRAIPEHIKLVHVDEDAWQIGKNYPVEVGLLGHTCESLNELATELAHTLTAEPSAAAAERSNERRQRHLAQRASLLKQIDEQRDIRPITPLRLMSSLARILPDNVAVIEEAVTTTNTTFERLGALKNTSGYFAHRGWALGWGLGCALGVKLAWPERPVLALLGEGATMYGVQGLWSAAKYNIPVTFVVCNNAQYQILKTCSQQMQFPSAERGEYLGLDLVEPEVDIVGLARSLGVEAHRVADPDELAERVSDSLHGDRPQLFDVPIQRRAAARLQYG